jgi:hypothetical protein
MALTLTVLVFASPPNLILFVIPPLFETPVALGSLLQFVDKMTPHPYSTSCAS